MRKKNFGFTLIELLVVMTIVAILTGLALVSIEGARKASRDGKRRTDLEQIRSSLEMYRADVGNYPGNLDLLVDYLDPRPADPISTYSYYYGKISDSSYRLCAQLEAGGAANPNCGSNCGGAAGTCNYEVNNP